MRLARTRALRVAGWWLLGLGVAADVVLLLPLGPIEPPLALHHLEHGLLLVAGGALATRLRPAKAALATGGSSWQLVAALLLSLLTLVGMAPDLYGYVDEHPLAHASLHVGFAALGFLSVAAAQRYARPLGPLWLWAFAVMTVVAITGFGAPPPA